MTLETSDPKSLQQQHSRVFSPDQVVCAILGRESVVLNGFGGDLHQELSLHIPNVPLPNMLETQVQAAIIAKSSKKRMLRLGVLAFSVVFLSIVLGVLIGSMPGKFVMPGSTKPAALVHWHAVAVRASGVELLVARERILIAVGGVLPSGEILQTVDVANQSFTTPNQVINVKKPKHE